MVDVHCHLTAREFEGRLDFLIEESVKSGVEVIITSGLGYEDSLKALKISDHKVVYPSIGVAPYDTAGYEKVLQLIEKERSRLIGIGEVGLDYWKGERMKRSFQQKVFEEFIDLARSLDLPLIVHSRSAGKYALEILFRKKAERVIMHAFDGRPSYAVEAAKRGYMFSIPPSIARSIQKQRLVKKLPLDSLLLESDAPVLAPYRNQVNHPKNVKVSAEWISRIKGIPFHEVVSRTTSNALELFGLKV